MSSVMMMDGNTNVMINQMVSTINNNNNSSGSSSGTGTNSNNSVDPLANHQQECNKDGSSTSSSIAMRHDLIATALDAAGIQEASNNATSDTNVKMNIDESVPSSGVLLEEGIIYRNNANPVSSVGTSMTTSPKVHFISNLTLVSKQQQPHVSNANNRSHNIIFVNNNTGNSSSSSNSGSNSSSITGMANNNGPNVGSIASANNSYLNSFVTKTSGGVVTTVANSGGGGGAGKIVMNVAKQQQHHQGKVLTTGPQVGTTTTQAAKGVNVLKRMPQQQNLVMSRPMVNSNSGNGITNTSAMVQQHQQSHKYGHLLKQQNLVIGTTKAVNAVTPARMTHMKVFTTGGGALTAANGGASGGGGVQTHKMVLGQQTATSTIRYKVPASSLSNSNTTSVLTPNNAKVGPTKSTTMASKMIPKVVQIQNRIVSTVSPQHSFNSNAMEGKTSALTGKYSVVQQQSSPSLQAPGKGIITQYGQHQAPTGGSSGAIKYVNAQGNVVQHLPVKYQKQQHLLHQENGEKVDVVNNNNVIQYGVTSNSTGHSQNNVGTKRKAGGANGAWMEEVFYVNGGTHMNDEMMSARILQSLSQQAVTTNNRGPVGGHPQQQQQHHQPTTQKFQYMLSGYDPTALSGSGGGSVKHGPEYFRVNTSDLQTPAATFIDNIPLSGSARIDDMARDPNNNSNNANQGQILVQQVHHQTQAQHQSQPYQIIHPSTRDTDQDDVIGVEVRPTLSTTDERMLRAMRALQDHTYVMQSPPSGQVISGQAGAMVAQLPSEQHQQQHLLSPSKQQQIHLYRPPMGGVVQQHHMPQQQQIKCTTNDLLTAAMGLGGYEALGKRDDDDDNNSVISNDSMRGNKSGNLDPDQGEETETAAEGEGEDDSVTRCICELTHDDGYMICCDKCSTWQHVDCMGIDRMNIPDEYNCDLCQPRPVDKNKARTLQLLKRREQQNLMMLQSVSQPQLTMGAFNAQLAEYQNGANNERLPMDGSGNYAKLNSSSPLKKQKAQANSSTMRRKADSTGTSFSVKKKREQQYLKGTAASGCKQRREKKQLTKRKGGQTKASQMTSSAMISTNATSTSSDDKHLLRMWIENYEKAMTNHYSPELRARLQAIGKQQQQMQQTGSSGIRPTTMPSLPVNLKNVGDLSGKCVTVPHAGGKILISTDDMAPHVPIVELRGKYMLAGQYRQQQQQSVGGGALAASGRQTGSAAFRIPGPFVFFYRLPAEGTELCVDTRTYGNEARFVRRSCRPNAEIVHHMEKGTIHLYVVSLLQIKASTEITVKHEPHDLLAITAAKANLVGGEREPGPPQPTSTACACGLVKDCLFYNAITPMGMKVGAPEGGGGSAGGRSKRLMNGHAAKMKAREEYRRSTAAGKSVSASTNLRTTSRSASSSGGECSSNTSLLLSPNVNCSDALMSPPMPGNNQSPSVMMSNGNVITVKEEKKEVNNGLSTSAINNVLKVDVEEAAIEVKKEPQFLTPPIKVEENRLVEVKEEESAMLKPALVAVVKKELHSVTESVVEVAAFNKVVKLESPSDGQAANNSALNTPVKRNKELKSLSEECLKAGPGAVDESRKLTREERKMEAIMKAFEKLEKSSQRKQQEMSRRGSDSSTMSRRRDSVSGGGRKDSSGDDRTVGVRETNSMGTNSAKKRRQRKTSKSYQQTNPRKIRRRSRVNSNDSDLFTSEDSTASLKASPPISVPFSSYSPLITARSSFEGRYNGGDSSTSPAISTNESSAANMLLSLANVATAVPNHVPMSPVSSAFMLVEAAIAPLETASASDFKMPKTKKSIMNDWLMDNEKEKEANEVGVCGTNGDQPQNLCKKVEEFIQLEQQGMVSEPMIVPPPMPTPPLAGGSESAVKKRWLRQAISEECSDEAPASPTNGYAATPLKKRRFSPEDLSPTSTNSMQGKWDTCDGEQEDGEEELTDVKMESPTEEEAPPPTKVNLEIAEPVIIEMKPKEEILEAPIADEKDVNVEKSDNVPDSIEPDVARKDADEIVAPAICPDGFDIEPLRLVDVANVEKAVVKVAPPEGSSGPDEMEDLQKRIHSFHTENILFLKSMNKKTKPNLSGNDGGQNLEGSNAYSSASVSAASSISSSSSSSSASSRTTSPITTPNSTKVKQRSSAKRKKLNFDGDEEEASGKRGSSETNDDVGMSDDRKKVGKGRRKSRFSSPISEQNGGEDENVLSSSMMNLSTFKSPDLTPSPSAAATLPFYAQAVAAAGGVSVPSQPVVAGIPQLGINTTIPPPQLPFNTIYGGSKFHSGTPLEMIEHQQQSSSRLLLSELLENAQKINTLGRFGVEVNQSPSSFSTLLERSALASGMQASGGSSTGYFTLNSKAIEGGSGLIGAATGVNPVSGGPQGSLSAIATHTATVANVTSAAASLRNNFPRVATADPRLNPNLNATPEPPPAPKRKLSINEYRKRMQQTSTPSTPGGSVSGTAESNNSSGNVTPVQCSESDDGGAGDGMTMDFMESKIMNSLNELKNSRAAADDDELLEGMDSCEGSPKATTHRSTTPSSMAQCNDENVVMFSAAPTRLEMQQESISERLKSYKSVTDLLTTKDGMPITTILQNNPLGTSIIDSLRTSTTAGKGANEQSTAAAQLEEPVAEVAHKMEHAETNNNNPLVVEKLPLAMEESESTVVSPTTDE